MVLNIAIYLKTSQVLTKDDFLEFAPEALINSVTNTTNSLTIKWQDMNIAANFMPQQAIGQHLTGLLGFVRQMGASTDIINSLSVLNHVIAFVIQDGIDEQGRLKKLVLGLVSKHNGYFFAANAFYDANNRLVVGIPNAPKQFFPPDFARATVSSIARKNRSITILESKNIPIIEHLPVIKDDAEVELRLKEDILRRAICLAIVASHAQTPDVKMAHSLIERYKVAEYLSPQEKVFAKTTNPEQSSRVNMSWRYEACYVLLWALGFINSLGEPDDACDSGHLIEIISTKTHDQLLQTAILRDKATILDEADLIYRYSWASVNTAIEQKPAPTGLHRAVVYERHYALNWLMCYGDADWDGVSTDT